MKNLLERSRFLPPVPIIVSIIDLIANARSLLQNWKKLNIWVGPSKLFIIGLVANGWGLKSLMQNWKKLKIINVFVLNLGLADILYLLTLPFLVVYYLMERKWVFQDVFCKITRFCFNLNLYGSIGFLTCISVYSALNPLIYLHGKEEIPARPRRLLQRARHMFKGLSLSDSTSMAPTITEEEL
ncbi:hypothetical protein Q8A73_013564 [Channa argus]|nr:hypothetical protein Q8A73_013564 [Channa argus]